MTQSAAYLATIHVASEANNAIVLWILHDQKHASFKQLHTATGQSTDHLRKCLEELQRYRLVRGEISDPENGSYLFYRLTESGTDCCEILQDTLRSMQNTTRETPPNRFLIDKQAFVTIFDARKKSGMHQLFDRYRIMLIDEDFAELRNISYASNTNDKSLEELLDDEHLLHIITEYCDEHSSISVEYYLRRVKRLSVREARLVASALDGKMALITNNKKIQQAARGMGVMCTGACEILEIKNVRLAEKFHELSIGVTHTYKSEYAKLEYAFSKMRNLNTLYMTARADKQYEIATDALCSKFTHAAEHIHAGQCERNDAEFTLSETQQIQQIKQDESKQKHYEQFKSFPKPAQLDNQEKLRAFSNILDGFGTKSNITDGFGMLLNNFILLNYSDNAKDKQIIDRRRILESINQLETAHLKYSTDNQKKQHA